MNNILKLDMEELDTKSVYHKIDAFLFKHSPDIGFQRFYLVQNSSGWRNRILTLIQGCFDHSLKKIRAKDGKTIWSYFYDDILKGTGSIFINDTAANPNNRISVFPWFSLTVEIS